MKVKKFLPETIFSLYILAVTSIEKSLTKIIWATLLVGIIFYSSATLRRLFKPKTIFLFYILLLLYGIFYYVITKDLEIITILPFLFLLFIYKYGGEILTKNRKEDENEHS